MGGRTSGRRSRDRAGTPHDSNAPPNVRPNGLGCTERRSWRASATGLKAGQIVGVLATPGPTLEILPKIDGRDDEVRAALCVC